MFKLSLWGIIFSSITRETWLDEKDRTFDYKPLSDYVYFEFLSTMLKLPFINPMDVNLFSSKATDRTQLIVLC